MAKRGIASRSGLRGRTMVAIVLVAFLAVSGSVVWRRSLGSTLARELHQLGEKHAALSAERARLEGDIRIEKSRARLTPVVARLGLHTPNDSQVIHLTSPRRER